MSTKLVLSVSESELRDVNRTGYSVRRPGSVNYTLEAKKHKVIIRHVLSVLACALEMDKNGIEL